MALAISAICAELAITGETLPDWIQIFAPGAIQAGRDGRAWALPDPYAVIKASVAHGTQIPIDINHSTELAAPKGLPAPAMGYIDPERLSVRRDGSTWAPVAWNELGREQAKGFRYFSPAFEYGAGGKDVLGTITRLKSVGLTNNPNFDLATALNAEDTKGKTMDPKTLEALGLKSDATQEQINARLAELSAANKAPKPVDETTVQSLIKGAIDGFKAEVMGVIEGLKGGQVATAAEAQKKAAEVAINAYATGDKPKITPAQVPYWVEQATDAEKLTAVCAYLDKAPAVIGNEIGNGGKPGNGDKLSAEEAEICKNMNIKPEDFLANKGNLYPTA